MMRDVVALRLIRLAARLTSMGDVYDKLRDAEREQNAWINYLRG